MRRYLVDILDWTWFRICVYRMCIDRLIGSITFTDDLKHLYTNSTESLIVNIFDAKT